MPRRISASALSVAEIGESSLRKVIVRSRSRVNRSFSTRWPRQLLKVAARTSIFPNCLLRISMTSLAEISVDKGLRMSCPEDIRDNWSICWLFVLENNSVERNRALLCCGQALFTNVEKLLDIFWQK